MQEAGDVDLWNILEHPSQKHAHSHAHTHTHKHKHMLDRPGPGKARHGQGVEAAPRQQDLKIAGLSLCILGLAKSPL